MNFKKDLISASWETTWTKCSHEVFINFQNSIILIIFNNYQTKLRRYTYSVSDKLLREFRKWFSQWVLRNHLDKSAHRFKIALSPNIFSKFDSFDNFYSFSFSIKTTTLHIFQHLYSSFIKSEKDPINNFRETAWTNVRTDRQTDKHSQTDGQTYP